MSNRNPFIGIWVYRMERSKSKGLKLEQRVQRVEATEEELGVREEMVIVTGARANVMIEARIDAQEYPIRASSMVKASEYRRVGRSEISRTGRKNVSVTLRETIATAENSETLTLTFVAFADKREEMNGVAVFERAEDQATLRADFFGVRRLGFGRAWIVWRPCGGAGGEVLARCGWR